MMEVFNGRTPVANMVGLIWWIDLGSSPSLVALLFRHRAQELAGSILILVPTSFPL